MQDCTRSSTVVTKIASPVLNTVGGIGIHIVTLTCSPLSPKWRVSLIGKGLIEIKDTVREGQKVGGGG